MEDPVTVARLGQLGQWTFAGRSPATLRGTRDRYPGTTRVIVDSYDIQFLLIEGGKTPLLSFEELQSLGYSMVVFPLTALFAATKAIARVYEELYCDKTTAAVTGDLIGFEEFERIVGVPELRALEERYGVAAPAQK